MSDFTNLASLYFHVVMYNTERGQMLFEAKENGKLVPNQNARALLIALPHIVKFDAFLRNYRPDVHNLAISDDVAAAFHTISSLRGEPTNMKVGQLGAHLDTQPFADDPSVSDAALMIMRAIYASQSPNFISNIVINYISNAVEAVQSSGVPIAEQDPLFEGGEVYQGATKNKVLSDTIAEAQKPKERETETGDEQTSLIPEGEEDAGETPGGDTTERTGSGDTGGDGDRTGRTGTDTPTDGTVVPGRQQQGAGDAEGTGVQQDGTGDEDSGSGGGRDAPVEQQDSGDAAVGESQTDAGGERAGGDESGRSGEQRGVEAGDIVDEAKRRFRERRGRGRQGGGGAQAAPADQTTPGEETTPTEPAEQTTPSQSKSKTDRVVDRMRRKRQQQQGGSGQTTSTDTQDWHDTRPQEKSLGQRARERMKRRRAQQQSQQQSGSEQTTPTEQTTSGEETTPTDTQTERKSIGRRTRDKIKRRRQEQQQGGTREKTAPADTQTAPGEETIPTETQKGQDTPTQEKSITQRARDMIKQ